MNMSLVHAALMLKVVHGCKKTTVLQMPVNHILFILIQPKLEWNHGFSNCTALVRSKKDQGMVAVEPRSTKQFELCTNPCAGNITVNH